MCWRYHLAFAVLWSVQSTSQVPDEGTLNQQPVEGISFISMKRKYNIIKSHIFDKDHQGGEY